MEEKILTCFRSYIDYCRSSEWLKSQELYKFEFGRWLNERVDLNQQSDEEILKICQDSQGQTYTDHISKGVNFILELKKYQKDFITIEDVEALRRLSQGENIFDVAAKLRMGFPMLSIWASTLFPDSYIPYIGGKMTSVIAYLFDIEDYPKNGPKSFDWAQGYLLKLVGLIDENFFYEEKELIALCFSQDSTVREVDSAWLIQDFIYYVKKKVMERKPAYYWVNHSKGFEKDSKNNTLSAPVKDTPYPARLRTMQKGDLLIHYVDQKIQAVSQVRKEHAEMPYVDDAIGEKMLVVETDYTMIDEANQLGLAEVKERLATYEDIFIKPTGPFDINGGIKQHYCFDFDQTAFDLICQDLFQTDVLATNGIQKSKNMNCLPLNQILYGPPGTGKTYHTINKALEIIHGAEYLQDRSRQDLVDEFNQLKSDGRIQFVTFHQSFCYEDFVEGIKPKLFDQEDQMDKGEIAYEIKDGIFKHICRLAQGLGLESEVIDSDIDFKAANYFKMSLGGSEKPDLQGWCYENDLAALGYGGDFDFSDYTHLLGDKSAFVEKFREDHPEWMSVSKYPATAVYSFMNLKKGDIILASKGNRIIDGVGVVKSDKYIFDDTQDVLAYQFREVEWIGKRLNASVEYFVNNKISQQSIYKIKEHNVNYDYFHQEFAKKEVEVVAEAKPKPYVLIIDEINRGNVAAIFGELITLIEADKRIGQENELTVTLPYSSGSEDAFGVPSNLYIIGTMNTADRSVEALDTALRRRFSFQEMMPNTDVITAQSITGGVVEDIHLAEVLKVINQRIEALIDRDHTIGHSYFMKVANLSDLKVVFRDKIYPLLQEYFYGDFGKIGLVLGRGFVERFNNGFEFANFESYDGAEYLDKERYQLIQIDESFDIQGAIDNLLLKS